MRGERLALGVNRVDLIRIGTYAQLEGSAYFSRSSQKPVFQFFTTTIDDMASLIGRVTGKEPNPGVRARFHSPKLWDELKLLGFRRYQTTDWNVPNVEKFSDEDRREYLRAVIDSLGNVDIEDGRPYIQVASHNASSLEKLAKIFNAEVRGPYDDRLFIRWRGGRATEILETLDWKFHNRRNQRGADLIKAVRWEDYI